MCETKIVTGFKGFDKNLKCRDFQFELGKEFKHQGKVEMCGSGFHFCEHPLDTFKYYPPAASRYAAVETSDATSDKKEDTKRVCKTLSIKAEVNFSAMVSAAIKFVFDRADWSKKETNATGIRGAASATGIRGAASATGYHGAASASGIRGAASATGDQGAASASGYQGAASATGDQGAASASGIRGAASASGYQGAASATGDQGAASASGIRGAASASGDQGAASASGIRGAASATGDQGAASASGYQGAASASGYQGAASASGYQGAAVALGIEAKAKGEAGCWLTISEWKYTDKWERINVQTKKVDGKKIKADTFYKLVGGKFVKA